MLALSVAAPEETGGPRSRYRSDGWRNSPAPRDAPRRRGAGRRIESLRATIVERTLRSPAVLANPRVPTAQDVEALLDAALGVPEVPGR